MISATVHSENKIHQGIQVFDISNKLEASDNKLQNTLLK